MVMQFYYKTLPGFDYPQFATNAEPAVGTVTPYLRPRNPDGSFAGDAVSGDANRDRVGDGNPMGIVYRPEWPADAPVLYMGESLTTPKRGLPAVRGQTSLEILYQQSRVAGGEAMMSALLHDPTREHEFQLDAQSGTNLVKLPGSVRTSDSRGRKYFPNLPPHLVERFWFDPNRGARGALVFQGEFKEEALGDNYLLLNLLSPEGAASLRGLCGGLDEDKARWDRAITNGLLSVPDDEPESIPPDGLSVVWDSGVAVASYALSAVGPGTGYLTLVAGDGAAFTPSEEPVSLHIVRVSNTLYRGEVKVVAGSNPLSEKITFQQVVDLAGRTGDYEFEWRIAAPQGGKPPEVYAPTPTLLGPTAAAAGIHVRHPLPTDRISVVHTLPAGRRIAEVGTQVVPVSDLPYRTVTTSNGRLIFQLDSTTDLGLLSVGNPLVIRDAEGREIAGTVAGLSAADVTVTVSIDPGQTGLPDPIQPIQLHERAVAGRPQSLVYHEITFPTGDAYTQFFLSLDLNPALGARVYVDGQLAVVANLEGATDSTSAPADFSALPKAYRLRDDLFGAGSSVAGGTLHRVAVELFSGALPGAALRYGLKLEAYKVVDRTAEPGTPWQERAAPQKVRIVLGETADVRALSDNYVISRYRATNPEHAAYRGLERTRDGRGGPNPRWRRAGSSGCWRGSAPSTSGCPTCSTTG